eukprot:m.41251 g.41251  ORF g.41251 m.41251 type:complete len:104 (+) comp10534_c0_seq2:713-1024(+)
MVALTFVWYLVTSCLHVCLYVVLQLMSQGLGTSATPALQHKKKHVVATVSAMTKVFAGELVELGLDIQQKRGIEGALRPDSLREAYRQLRTQGKVPLYEYETR